MPVPPRGRLSSLDLVRGFAVLGILPANLPHFIGPMQPPTEWGNRVAAALVLLLIDFKMITALAILFGAGLALQESNARERGDPWFGAKYLWRQALLLLLGLSHGLFLWFGDILATYAILGSLALCLVLIGSDWVRIVCVGALGWFYTVILAITCIILLGGVTIPPQKPPPPARADDPAVSLFRSGGSLPDRLEEYFTPANQVRIYRHGSFLDQFENRALFVSVSLFSLPILMGWYLLGCFLLGMQLVWAGAFHPGPQQRWFAELFLMLGLTIGVPCHVAAVVVSLNSEQSPLPAMLNLLGGLSQSLMYIGLLLLWDGSEFWPALRERLRAVGRMALTNYLMQSVLLTFLFYSYGLGWYGQFGLALALPLVPLVWALELAWSPVWLRVFAAGPIEWLWRTLADGRFQPILAR